MIIPTKTRINYSFIKILTGSDLAKRRIPYMIADSQVKGPNVWLTACMHGDEIGGTVILHELFKRLKKGLIRGSIHALPLLNPFGLETVSRNIALSKEDLNRSFPGDEKGTLAQRIAYKIFRKITEIKPALVLDLHNDWTRSIPYALLDPKTGDTMDSSIRSYAESTGLLLIQDTDLISSSLTYNLILNDIPAFVLELGESYTINEKNIVTGLKAVWNILQHLDIVETDTTEFSYSLPAPIKGKLLKYSPLPLSSSSGILRFQVKPGDIVRKGQKIARVYNAFGKLSETIVSLNNAIVIGVTDTAISFPGSPIMAFGVLS